MSMKNIQRHEFVLNEYIIEEILSFYRCIEENNQVLKKNAEIKKFYLYPVRELSSLTGFTLQEK